MNDYSLQHIFTYTGVLANPPEVIGPVPEGVRVNFYVVGGDIAGPGWQGKAMRGKLRPAGGDWVTVRSDGVALLDVRTTFEMEDGALIYVTYPGVADFGPGGQEKFVRGEMPPVLKLHISPRFHTSHPEYQWLNRLHCLGIGEYHPEKNEARYDIYAVR